MLDTGYSMLGRLSARVCVLTAIVLSLTLAAGGNADVTSPHKDIVIQADFGRWADYPLVKTKFAAYNSGWVPGQVKTYARDIRMFDEVRPDTLRIDGVMGSPKHILFSDPPIISGTPDGLKYDFRQADELARLMQIHDVRMNWCYSYIPESLGGRFSTPPRDLTKWSEVVGAIARHFRESKTPIEYHEVYNEPDNQDFFKGSVQDYIALYESAAKAIRTADPDAAVGGPALAFTDAWVEPFLTHVTGNRLPLDFFSFHYYPGVPYKARSISELVDSMRAELGKHPELATTEMHLNEYNSLPINYPENGPQQKHRLAAQLLADYAYFITQPSLTKVHWAQFMDTGGGNWSGVVSIDGHRKATFNAWKLYSMMPVDRRGVSLDGPEGLGAMASSDDHKSALLVWNLSGADQPVTLHLANVPFARGTVRVYRIDATHASWGDNPANEHLIPVEARNDVETKGLTWTGNIPDGGIVYLETDDGTKTKRAAPPAEAVRVLHYFPDRNSRAYADFDRNTWTARLGMGGEESADAVVGVRAKGLPPTLTSTVTTRGIRNNRRDSLLCVQVDYEVNGEYTKSVLFHDGVYHPGTTPLPWGTKESPDELVATSTRIPLSQHAPQGWKGNGIVSFRMRSTGPTSRAKITINRQP